jgi:RNA polymerase sigma factor (sigma-70 family)
MRMTSDVLLAVRQGNQARDDDDAREKLQHRPSSLRARVREPADHGVLGGRSPETGMTRDGKRSQVRGEGRAESGSYTRSAAPDLAVRAPVMRDTTAPLTVPPDRAAAAYGAHHKVLRYVGSQKFHIPDEDVEDVIHEVFLAFMRNEAKIACTERDERSWLVGAMCNASRYYWRKRRGDEPQPDEEPIDPARLADEAITRGILRNVLDRLPERCRAVLWRRYGEEYTPREIGEAESLKRGSAKNLISKCLLAARACLRRLLQKNP